MNVPLITGVNLFRPAEVIPTYDDTNRPTNFTGDWDAPADPRWIGTITGVGPRPRSAIDTGVATYDFVGLMGGLLPEGTYVHISDLDRGSGLNELIELTAFDLGGNAILEPWLKAPGWISGPTATPTETALASALPSYAWDPNTGVYRFDGSTESFPTNPSVILTMTNSIEIAKLKINDRTIAAGFGIGAPLAALPLPGSLWLLGLGLMGLIASRSRYRV